MADKTLTELVINRGTKQKFDDLPTKSPDELYFITDGDYFATKTDLPESKTGTTGQVYTKTETGAEWQDASGGSSLPDQTGNAGKFLTTDGANASWGDALVNHSSSSYGLAIGNLSGVDPLGAPWGGLALGYGTNTYRGAMLLNSSGELRYNNEVGTFKVCITNEVYTLMDVNGLIPSARLAADGTTGQVLTKTDAGMEWQDAGGGGDYLPLSGGALNQGAVLRFNAAGGFYGEIKSGADHPLTLRTVWPNLSTGEIYFDPLPFAIRSNKAFNIGSAINVQGTFYFKKLNNGADIDVPTTGGTMVVATPPTAAGKVLTSTETGAEWKDAGGGSGRNIGDIFYTTRTDTSLAGAVECNGGTYSTADYTGAGSIGELLAGGKLDYISLTDYATAISTKGWCDKIGWNGTGTTSFRVPTLTPHIIQKNNIAVIGNGITIGLTDGNSNIGLAQSGSDTSLLGRTNLYGANQGTTISGGAVNLNHSLGLTTDPTKSGIIADTTDTAQLRVMFQLFNSTTDEAVATVGTVVAQVGELRNMSNITATGKETVVGWGMPDYSAGISVGTSFTASSDGLVIYTLSTVGGGIASVNNVQILVKIIGSNYDYAGISQMFYVSKGDIVNISVGGTFYPLKGVN